MRKKKHKNIKFNSDMIDILGRNEFVDICKLLIDAIFDSTTSSFIMIDGEWGTGKTFAMNMLEDILKEEKKYDVLKYNCWENSYYNDPLTAMLSMMLEEMEVNVFKKSHENENNVNHIKLSKYIKLALNLLRDGGKSIITIPLEKINELLNNDKAIFQADSIESNLYLIIKEIKGLLKINNTKTIILVDELDRCLPEYSIKTLERLYLLFRDIPNMILIIANDKSKLEKSINNVFGYDTIDNYLEKFIDYDIKLSNKYTNNDENLLYLKYLRFNDYFTINASDIKNITECDLLNFIFKYLIVTKNIRYIDKLIKFHSNIHMLIFKENSDIPLHVFLIELLMIEFSKKTEELTIENIINIIQNTDYNDNLIHLVCLQKDISIDNYKFVIKNPDFSWKVFFKKMCNTKEEKKVDLFFQFMEDFYKEKYEVFNVDLVKKFNLDLEVMSNKYFKNNRIERVLIKNPGKYNDIEKYLQKLIDFYTILYFIEPI